MSLLYHFLDPLYIVRCFLSFVAQSERENIKKRQAEGIAAARARGVHLGRPAAVVPSGFPEIVRALDAGEITIEEALKSTGMSIATFYRRRREHKLMKSGAK